MINKIAHLLSTDLSLKDFFLENISQLLKDYQLQLTSSSKERESLILLKDSPPLLILFDWDHQVLDLEDLMATVNFDQDSLSPDVIVLSQNPPSHEEITMAYKKGVSDFIGHYKQSKNSWPMIEAKINQLIKSQIIKQKALDHKKQIECYLEEIEEKKEQYQTLLRILTHDISNPLSVIDFHTVMLKKSLSDPSETKRISSIEVGLQQIKEILTMIREMHALESGKRQIEMNPLPVIKIINQSIEMFEEKLKAKNLKLELINEIPETKSFLGDPVIFQHQILNNIISNAIKFAPVDSSLMITAMHHNQILAIKIQDQGIGMDEQLQKDIFLADKKTSRPGTMGEKGTGFGMPLMKSFVEKFGGQVRVHSRPIESNPQDHGTTFTLFFKSVDLEEAL